MLKVVVFNAPPRTGKGEAASYLTKLLPNSYHKEFKDELFKIAANTLGISVEEYLTDYDRQTPDKVWWMKDLVSISTSASMKTLGDKKLYSQRDFLIHVSENVIKPSFGKDAFGKAFVNNLPQEGYVFVSDGGFKEEIQSVIDHVSIDNIMVVRIHREGHTFEGDSRTYLTEEMFEDNIKFIDIDNNSTLDDFICDVVKNVRGWLDAED